MEDKVMLDYTKLTPYPNKPLIVRTKWGLRKAILLYERWYYGYKLTDCTHPLQNCHLSQSHIIEWRYENDEDMDALLFHENTWWKEYQRKESEKILTLVKLTWFDKLRIFLKTKLR